MTDFRWGDYRLEDPAFLLLELFVPLVILVAVLRRRRSSGVVFTRVAALTFAGGLRYRLRWLPFAFRTLAVLLLVIALARPQHGRANASVDAEGIDMVLVLDISSSMSQRDFGGRSRLQVAQETLRSFIEQRTDDRIGLAVFQSEVRVLSPLTLDHDPLLRLITSSGDLNLGDGTAIGMGTAEGVNALRDSRSRSRVVVVATDGENNSGAIEPVQAARLAEALGINLYTIGIVGASRNEVDEATLRQMADIGGGFYTRATDPEGLADAYERIGELETSRVTRDRFLSWDELAPYALAAAVGAIVIEAILRATFFRRIPVGGLT